jgi:hypothetical protein
MKLPEEAGADPATSTETRIPATGTNVSDPSAVEPGTHPGGGGRRFRQF